MNTKYRLYHDGKPTELAYATEYEANYTSMILWYFTCYKTEVREETP